MLTQLSCFNNSITGVLDLSTCSNLSYVNAVNNMLTAIKVWNTNILPVEFYYDAGVTITN